MVNLHDCYHCHHYCYSHRSSLSKLQFAYAGLTLSVCACIDICCQACLPVEWIQTQYFIHSPISERFPCAGTVLGTGDAGTNKTRPALMMILTEGQQGRLTARGPVYPMCATSLTHNLHPRWRAQCSARGAVGKLGLCSCRPWTSCLTPP